jgi:hypothetical protein
MVGGLLAMGAMTGEFGGDRQQTGVGIEAKEQQQHRED